MNTFFKVLSSLSSFEKKKFEKHLKRLYKPDTIHIKVYHYYSTVLKRKKEPLDIVGAYRKIFKQAGNNKTELAKLRNGLSDLFLELKEFLIIEKFKNKAFEKDLLWMEILDEKDLVHNRKLYERKILKQVELDAIKNIWYPLEKLRFYHAIFFRNNFQKNDSEADLLSKSMEELEEFYRSMKMKLSAEIVNRKTFLPPESISPQLQLFFSEIENENNATDHPSSYSALYFLLFKFLQNRSFNRYQEVKKFLIDNNSKIHQDEKLTILIYLINFLNAEIKKNKPSIMEEVFDLYQFGLDEEILIYKNKISQIQFTNIITTACYLKKYAWAENFINTYKSFLSEASREEKAMIGLMIVNFKKKNFEQVLVLFSQINFTNILFKISGRIHFLASLYETKEFENFENSLESFIRFLHQNKKLGKVNKESALTFARILKYLFRKNLPQSIIQKEFAMKENVFFGNWLQEKIHEYRPIE